MIAYHEGLRHIETDSHWNLTLDKQTIKRHLLMFMVFYLIKPLEKE